MDYPNIEAMASGTISGKFTEWPRVRPEAKALLAELAALREENARLKADMAFHMGNARVFEADLKTARRERDEARAEVEKERAYADASNQDAIAAEAEAKKYHDALVARHGGEPVALLDELDEARAEVSRLEGLILRWYEGEGNPNVWLAFSKEACRIRAQREERCPYCANPIGDGSGGTCTAECHAKGDSCRCAQREEGKR